ncbi:MAG: response regulator [Bacteroidetes bacterium]|nr:MAG: response regulator [Bacteroidota bacterium]
MKSALIFIVDKNPIHSSLLKYHLTIQRFSNVQLYHSAEECLYRLRKHVVPQYLIADYDLADQNGFDFLRMVKKLSPSTEVLFFSTLDDPILAVQLIDSGATDYIMKTSRMDYGISDLVKNLEFLQRKKVPGR